MRLIICHMVIYEVFTKDYDEAHQKFIKKGEILKMVVVALDENVVNNLRQLNIMHDDFHAVVNHILTQETKRKIKNNNSDVASMEAIYYSKTYIDESKKRKYPNNGNTHETEIKDVITHSKKGTNIVNPSQNKHEKPKAIHKPQESRQYFCEQCDCRHRRKSPIGIRHKEFEIDRPVDKPKDTRSPLHKLNIGLSIITTNISKTTDPEKLERYTQKLHDIEKQIEEYNNEKTKTL